MKRTRLSLFYLATYLLFAGMSLTLVPSLALQLLLANGTYGDALPRLLGVLLFALGVVIAQIIRLHIEVLYTTTIFVRVIILLVIASLYWSSNDSLFLSLFAIVGFGVILTTTSYFLDRKRSLMEKPAA